MVRGRDTVWVYRVSFDDSSTKIHLRLKCVNNGK
jgi:hypothetical protein